MTDRLKRVATSAPVNRTAAIVTSKGMQGPERPTALSPGEIESDAPIPVEPFAGAPEHDLTGQRFGFLRVMGRYASGKKNSRGGTPWSCRCDCGKYIVRRTKSLKGVPSRMRCRDCDWREELKSHGCNPRTLALLDSDHEGLKVQRIRAKYMERKPNCFYCGIKLTKETATLDHIVPRSKGGETTEENTALACYPCNTAKGAHG